MPHIIQLGAVVDRTSWPRRNDEYVEGTLQAAKAMLPHLIAARKAWQGVAKPKHITFGQAVWDGSMQAGLRKLITRVEVVLAAWEDHANRPDKIEEVAKEVITIIDKHKLGCSDRQEVRRAVERHYG